jgi:hypothetical protein
MCAAPLASRARAYIPAPVLRSVLRPILLAAPPSPPSAIPLVRHSLAPDRFLSHVSARLRTPALIPALALTRCCLLTLPLAYAARCACAVRCVPASCCVCLRPVRGIRCPLRLSPRSPFFRTLMLSPACAACRARARRLPVALCVARCAFASLCMRPCRMRGLRCSAARAPFVTALLTPCTCTPVRTGPPERSHTPWVHPPAPVPSAGPCCRRHAPVPRLCCMRCALSSRLARCVSLRHLRPRRLWPLGLFGLPRKCMCIGACA